MSIPLIAVVLKREIGSTSEYTSILVEVDPRTVPLAEYREIAAETGSAYPWFAGGTGYARARSFGFLLLEDHRERYGNEYPQVIFDLFERFPED